MSSALYTPFKKLLLDGDIDLLTDNIKVCLVDTDDYTFSAAHDFLDDVLGIVATSGNLASKTTTGGTFDAADVTFTAVTGDQSEALVIYKDTGVAATSPLIAYIDTASSGLPVTPNSGDIVISFSASGIFSL